MSITYLDTSTDEVRSEHAEVLSRIQDESLIYPVTFVDDEPVYDGAVSYPVIMRNVDVRIAGARPA